MCPQNGTNTMGIKKVFSCIYSILKVQRECKHIFFRIMYYKTVFHVENIMKDCFFFHIEDNVRLLYKFVRLFYIYRIM